MKMTPDSTPSYLNDLIGNLLQFVDQTDIRTQTGNNGPFNYRLVPYIGNSDHAIFLDAGIASMQFNHWHDNFYHSSEDRAIYADPTEMKRVGFMGGAAFYYLANAGPAEARDLAWEATANGEKWITEVARQSARLIDGDASGIHDRHKAAQMKVTGAFNRARGGVESVQRLSNDATVAAAVKRLVTGLEAVRDVQARKLNAIYQDRAQALGTKAQPVGMTPAEQGYAGLVPRKRYKFYTADARAAAEKLSAPGQPPPAGPRLPAGAATEVALFIDGIRSIYDIYQAVRAEFGQVTTSSNEMKFAYVVTPATADVDIEAVAGHIRAMEAAGLVEITKKAR
jgi:hypothetical protein